MSATTHRARNKGALILALVYGVLSEAALGAAFYRRGQVIDNGNALGFITTAFHLPGIMLAGLFGSVTPGQDYSFYAIVMALGAAQFSLLYWCVIKLWTRRYGH